MLKNKIYFVAAIGTDIGKTFLVSNICRILRERKIAVSAIKPVASGFVCDDLNSDSVQILQSLGLEVNLDNIAAITPWRFEKALSPHLAARKEGKDIDFNQVVNFCRQKIELAKSDDHFLFIEGAGGVMTPLSDDKTFLDLVFELKIPVLLLSANYLGSISHTLSAIAAATARGIEIEKLIINEHEKISDSSISAPEMIEAVENFTKIKAEKITEFLTIMC